ncbi:MAG: SpoIIE family protein phosphatase [bacterium]|nr:SpoIIE family protein phosphatase [bacterium]
MVRGFLVFDAPRGRSRRVPVGDAIVLGRAVDCGLVIDDEAASRHHTTVYVESGAFRWRDMGSTNGTVVNGVEKREGALRNGDQLRIGETVLTFEEEDSPAPTPAVDGDTHFTETIVDWNEESSLGDSGGTSGSLLRAVYAVINEISSNYEPCSLVDRVLETTAKAIDAQRGAIFFAGKDARSVGPCPVCHKYHMIEEGVLNHIDEGEIQISNTVCARVLKRGESVLYQDTEHDTELNLAQSVVSLHLRSIICAPVRGKSGILGILYIDTNREGQQYTHEHMLLSTAVGNSAGLALENATMHQQMLEKQRMEQEIQHAWTIQEGFLVKEWPDDDPRFQVYGQTCPAKTVGGDFYDLVRPAENRVGILIGDVSGKGVPAALTMAQLLAEFRLCARGDAPPDAVLRALNAELFERSQRGTFCTLAYLTLDLSTGRATYSNAGHHPTIRITRKGVRVFGGASGPPAGVLGDGPWDTAEVALNPGDTILLYTDGIVEARENAARERGLNEFGMERLCQAAHDAHEAGPKGVVTDVRHAVERYCEPGVPHDDCTMIALRYMGA